METAAHNQLTDTELLDKYRQTGNKVFVGVLYKRYSHLVFGLCMKYFKDQDQAYDTSVNIFTKLFDDLKKHKVEYFKSWIYMVAKNHCLMQLRDKPGKNTVEVKESIAAETDEPDKESLLLNEKTYEYMGEALKELNADQQLCVTLFYMEKKSYQQITEQTGYSMMQVKSHIQNGKRNMRILIEKKMNG